jgi:16S rRNA processing protein RimM
LSNQRALFAIGKITKVFGIKGEVVVRPMSASPERFTNLKHVYLGSGPDDVLAAGVEYTRVEDRGVRIRFRGLPDRTTVEPFVGALIFVDEHQLIKPKKGSHFIHDIVGLRVVDEHNREIGVVKDVLKYPAQDVYVINQDGREWMIPAVKEFVRSIDVSARTMKVHLIEGMMEQG